MTGGTPGGLALSYRVGLRLSALPSLGFAVPVRGRSGAQPLEGFTDKVA